MRFKLLVALLITAAMAVTFGLFRSDIMGLTDQGRTLIQNDPGIGSLRRDAIALKDQVFTSTPLKIDTGDSKGELTLKGIISLTNKERLAHNAVALSESSLLNKAAEAKLDDMFDKQYFEHESPDGRGPADLADDAGYRYVIVGENLALGNFGSDAALVKGWMDSPGHRENILREGYREIGVAARQGNFQGKMTWLAVQEFGTSETACPEINATLGAEIETSKASLNVKEADLSSRAQAIDRYEPKRGEEYNQMVNEYNVRVEQYNTLVQLLKKNIELYNTEAQNYNTCLASFSE